MPFFALFFGIGLFCYIFDLGQGDQGRTVKTRYIIDSGWLDAYWNVPVRDNIRKAKLPLNTPITGYTFVRDKQTYINLWSARAIYNYSNGYYEHYWIEFPYSEQIFKKV
jgi:hypothetical protein